jgi:hypothetical protein
MRLFRVGCPVLSELLSNTEHSRVRSCQACGITRQAINTFRLGLFASAALPYQHCFETLKAPLRGWADWVLVFFFDGYYLHVYYLNFCKSIT